MAQRTFSYKQYRGFDITIFAIILCVLEAIVTSLSNNWENLIFALTLVYAISSIVIMRWGAWGAVHLILGGIVRVACLKGDWYQYVAFIAGNLFALLSLLLIKFVGAKKVRDSFGFTILFILIIYVSVSLGRTVILSIATKKNFFDLFITSIATESLSLLLTTIIVMIARKQDGVFENQKAYLIRTEEKRKKELQNTNYED